MSCKMRLQEAFFKKMLYNGKHLFPNLQHLRAQMFFADFTTEDE